MHTGDPGAWWGDRNTTEDERADAADVCDKVRKANRRRQSHDREGDADGRSENVRSRGEVVGERICLGKG